MIHGANRKWSDKYGLTVNLCPECHRRLHSNGIMNDELKKIAESEFIKKYSKEDFMRIFGKDYLYGQP